MSATHHPDITTLMAFSAGTLDEPFALVVSTHLAICPECRASVDRLNAIGGAYLEGAEESTLQPDALERLMARLDEPAAKDRIEVRRQDLRVPPPLARYLPDGLDAAPWKRKAPGVWVCDLPVSPGAQSRLMMLKVAGGQKMPEHGHGGHELTLILQGAYADRFGRFGFGDMADHDQDVEHQPIAEKGEACVCLVAVDSKLSFRSRLMRLLQPLIGM